MYAIIEVGGKQYRVEKGDVIEVELLKSTLSEEIDLKNVLFINDGRTIMVGSPTIDSCLVKAKVLEELKGPKVIAYKYKRRKSYHRKVGHRQKYTQLEILDIVTKG